MICLLLNIILHGLVKLYHFFTPYAVKWEWLPARWYAKSLGAELSLLIALLILL